MTNYNPYHNVKICAVAKFKLRYIDESKLVWAWCDKIKNGSPGLILNLKHDRITVKTRYPWSEQEKEIILTFKLKKMRGLKIWYCYYNRDEFTLANYDEKRWWFRMERERFNQAREPKL